MPDISMCKNGNLNGCEHYKTCYRFVATPGYFQSFDDFTPKEGEDKCEDYWETKS